MWTTLLAGDEDKDERFESKDDGGGSDGEDLGIGDSEKSGSGSGGWRELEMSSE